MAAPREPTDEAFDHLRSARPVAPRLETDRALARLQATLFGVAASRPTVGRYCIVRRLGHGASGVVYLAHDPQLSRNVALKVLHPTLGGAHRERDRILREAKSLARVCHPNIVEVYDVGTTPGPEASLYLAMELVEGEDLRTWLAARPPWREVLRVFEAAARGLVAAHAVGVIHRDFKPPNAIVGRDGRVRVVDFGLARTTESEETDPGDVGASMSGADRHGTTLTATGGGVLGTPAYMAPEQHAGLPASPASDQYAWCLSLWEGLYGTRPFRGTTPERLQALKLAGAPRPPRGTDVPRGLARLLQRGLQPVVARRWPSMQTLLAEIDALREAPRRRPRGVLLGAVALVGLATAIGSRGADDPCAGADDRWAQTWTQDRQRQLADQAGGGALVPLETFGEAWAAAHRQVCRGVDVDATSAPTMLDGRMACLDEQLHRVDAMLGVVADTEATGPTRTAKVLQTLPVPADCVDLATGPQVVPADSGRARAVAQIRERIAEADAFALAGRYAVALEAAVEATQRAEEVGFEPIIAEALTTRGRIEQDVGRLLEAEQSLTRAHELAIASGHDRQAARASLYLVYLVGRLLHRHEVALRWAQTCEAEIVRSEQPHLRAGLLLHRAEVLEEAGELQRAEQDLDAALAITHTDPIRHRVRTPTIHNNLGNVLRQTGRRDEARGQFELARDAWIVLFGPDHPDVAIALTNLATLDLLDEAANDAVERLSRAIEIRTRVLPADHPLLATTRASLAVALRESGDLAAARAILLESVDVLRARPDPPAEELVTVYTSLGTTARAAGDHEAARAWFEQSLATVEGTFLVGGRTHALVLLNRALTAVHLGDIATGTRALDDAMAIEAQWMGRGHPTVASRRFLMAAALREAGAESAATAVGRQALQDLDESAAPQLHAEIDAWLHGA